VRLQNQPIRQKLKNERSFLQGGLHILSHGYEQIFYIFTRLRD